MLARPTIAFAVAAATLASASPSSAAVRYADPASTDQVGSCASLQPCRLDHAVNDAQGGDVVVVGSGTYNVSYSLKTSGAVTIRGAAGQGRPHIVGGSGGVALLEMPDGGALRNVHLESDHASSVLAVEGATVRGVVVVSSTVGANIRDASGGTVVSDSVIRASGASPAVETKDGKTDGPLKLLNVTLYAPDSSATALKVKQAGTTGTVIRNSIVRGGSGDVKVYKGSIGTVDHSNFRVAMSSGYADAGANQEADPQFADAAAGDLHLLAGSPAADAGTAADPDLGAADPDGFRRALGAGPDLGAFEYVAPGTADALTPPEPDPVSEDASTPGGGNPNSHPAIDPPAPPKPGRRMGVEPVKGNVKIRPPGGGDFVSLEDAASVPVGSVVDATNGTVELTTARDASGEPQTGRFWGGRFKVTQNAETGQYTELKLVGGDFSACKAHAKVSAARLRKGVRQLWGRDHRGRFRTRGRGGHATVRGTHWLTRDRCDGTLFKVTEGAIDVKRPGKRKRVRVKAGEKFLAKLR